MISRQDKKNFFVAHWDWLVAGGGVLALGAAALMLMMASGEDPEMAAQEEVAMLGRGQARTGVDPVDMTAYGTAMKVLVSPTKLTEVAETQGSFLASDRRVFCEQGDANGSAACGAPIPFGSKVCPFCQAEQPGEEKGPRDSDRDGIPDDLEVKWGMNPQDPSDIHGDLDQDGFTNEEEFLAKTDPTDSQSHPDYLNFVSIKLPLVEKTLPFFCEKATPTRDSTRLFFKGKTPGVTYSVLLGEKIGDTGFIAKSFKEDFEERKISGTGSRGKDDKMVNVLTRKVDISTATVERLSDRKTIALRVGDRKYAAVDMEATLVFNRKEVKEFVVVEGDTIDLHGTKYQVASISRDDKKVKVLLTNEKFGRKVIEALEQ